MKEVLYRIFEANPNKKDIIFFYVQNNYNHYFEVFNKSNTEVLHSIELSNFQSLKENEQIAIVNTLNSVLDWYNLQP